MKKIKFVIILLIAIMCAFSFAACASEDDKNVETVSIKGPDLVEVGSEVQYNAVINPTNAMHDGRYCLGD